MAVKIGSGVTYSQLLAELSQEQLAIINVPSLPHLNVIGSMVTGSHGGAAAYAELATMLQEIEIVDYVGNFKVIKSSEENFKRVIHSFGMLGAITSATLELVPNFGLRKCIYENLSWDMVSNPNSLNDMLKSKDYISFFTTFQDRVMTSVWTAEIVHSSLSTNHIDYKYACFKDLYGSNLVYQIHPVPGRNSNSCVTSGYGTWYNKLYHFRPDEEPSSGGDEL